MVEQQMILNRWDFMFLRELVERDGSFCGFYSLGNRFSYSTTQKSPLNKLLSKSPRINGEENNINKPLSNSTRIE
jgi:hypothetical protein